MIGISEGIVLANRYRLVRRQFERGIGAGWVAVDAETSAEVWVQFTRHGGLEAVGELLRRHGHAGMPAVLDTGEFRMIVDSSALAVRADQDAHASHVEIVIEFVVCRPITGRAMSAKVSRKALTPAEALMAVAGLAEALELSLREGYSHGWLTGESVWITRRGACALDLALGLCAADDLAIEVEQEVTGCFAPERLAGGAAAEAADVFALGWLLYILLIGYAALQIEYARVVAEAGAATTVELLTMWRKRARRHILELLGADSALAALLVAALAERPEDRPTLAAFHPGAREAAGGMAGVAALAIPLPAPRHRAVATEAAVVGAAVAGVAIGLEAEALLEGAGGAGGAGSAGGAGGGSAAAGLAGSESLSGSEGLAGSESYAGSHAGGGFESASEVESLSGSESLAGAGAASETGSGSGSGAGTAALLVGAGAGAAALIGGEAFAETGAESLAGSGSGTAANTGSASGSGAGTGAASGTASGSGAGSASGSAAGFATSAGAGSASSAVGAESETVVLATAAGAGGALAAEKAGFGSVGLAKAGFEQSEAVLAEAVVSEEVLSEAAVRWRRKLVLSATASTVGALVVGVLLGYLWGHGSNQSTTIATAAVPGVAVVTTTDTAANSAANSVATTSPGSASGSPTIAATTAPAGLATATQVAGAGTSGTASPGATGSGTGASPAPTTAAAAYSQLTESVRSAQAAGQISSNTASSLLSNISETRSATQGSATWWSRLRALSTEIQSGQQKGTIPTGLANQLTGVLNYFYSSVGS